MRRTTAVLLALLLALATAACGEDEQTTAGAASSGVDTHFTLSEAEGALEAAGLELVRDREAIIAGEIDPAPADSVRFAEQSGVEFELLVFATPGRAERAADAIAATEMVSEGGAYAVAWNLAAVFPGNASRAATATYLTALQAIERLAERARADSAAPGVSLSEIAAQPERYAGRVITVEGTLGTLLPSDAADPLALELVRPGDGTILVVPGDDEPVPDEVAAGAARAPEPRLRVTGRVRLIGSDTADVPHADVLRYREGNAVLLADEIELLR